MMMTAAAARSHEQGVASGVLTTSQQAGGAPGVAVAAATQRGTAAKDGDTVGLWVCVAFVASALVVCAGLLRGRQG
jgi:hypothetical protein